MFRGVDPDGIHRLATAVESTAVAARREGRIAAELLTRNTRLDHAAALESAVAGIDQWGNDTARSLRWRGDTIRRGQTENPDFVDLLLARFAAGVVSDAINASAAAQQWVAAQRAATERIDAAVTDISRWLSQGWTDWDVTRGDLHNIWSTLAGLSGDELTAVIIELTPHQLERWIDEMEGSFNGLSPAAEREIFTMLATNSSGDALGRVHDAILAVGHERVLIDFGRSVETSSPDTVIVDFVRYVVSRDLTKRRFSAVAPLLAAGGLDTTPGVEETVRLLMADGVFALAVADGLAAGHVVDTGEPFVEINPLGSLLRSIDRVTDPGLRAVSFSALTTVIGHSNEMRGLLRTRLGTVDSRGVKMGGGDDHRYQPADPVATMDERLLTAATRLLVTDTDEIIAKLASSADATGSAMTDYLRRLLATHRLGDLSRVVNAARGGDAPDAGRFADPSADPNYAFPYAQNLAYVAATLNEALQGYAADAGDRIDDLTTIASIATTVAGVFLEAEGFAASLMAGGVGGSVDLVGPGYWGDKVKGSIDGQLEQLMHTVETGMRPYGDPTAAAPTLGEALMWWDRRYSSIRFPEKPSPAGTR